MRSPMTCTPECLTLAVPVGPLASLPRCVPRMSSLAFSDRPGAPSSPLGAPPRRPLGHPRLETPVCHSRLTTALYFYDRGVATRRLVQLDRALQVADEQQHEQHAAALVDVKGARPAAAAAALRAVLAEVDA